MGGAARQPGPAAGCGLPGGGGPGLGPGRLLPATHAVLARILRRGVPRLRPPRPRALLRAAAGAGERAHAGAALAPLPVLRSRRPDLLRLRLGHPAARDGLPGHLPGAPGPALALSAEQPAHACRDRAAALADVAAHARGGSHQAPGRPVLARSQLPRLPLRDPAEPESPLLVFPPAPRLVPPARGPRQPRRRAGGSALRIRPAAAAARGRRLDHRVPDPADPEREPVVPELAHHRGGDRLPRRRCPPSPRAEALARPTGCARVGCEGRQGSQDRGLRTRRGGGRAQREPGPEPALVSPDDERGLRPLRPREHLRSVRQRHPGTLRDRARRHGGRPRGPGCALGRAPLRVQARRTLTASVLDLALPRAARLADVVPGHAGSGEGRLVPRARGEAPRRRPEGAPPARSGSLRGDAAARHSSALFCVSLHPLGRGPGLVGAQAGRLVSAATHARRSAAGTRAAPGWSRVGACGRRAQRSWYVAPARASSAATSARRDSGASTSAPAPKDSTQPRSSSPTPTSMWSSTPPSSRFAMR